MMVLLRDTSMGSQIFTNIREGMSVYDVNGDRVGRIKQLYFGASIEPASEEGEGSAIPSAIEVPGQDSLVENITKGFTDEDQFPDALRQRLLHDGFLRIDGTGIFAPDRFVTPEQVANIDGVRVNLNVTKDELIKR